MATSLFVLGARCQFAIDANRARLSLIPGLHDVTGCDDAAVHVQAMISMVDSSTDVADEDRDLWRSELQWLLGKIAERKQHLIDNPPPPQPLDPEMPV